MTQDTKELLSATTGKQKRQEKPMIKKWTYCNCDQCWNCKNRTDVFLCYKEKAIKDSPISPFGIIPKIDEEYVLLPYCKVQDEAMTYVNHNPCDKYEELERY